MFDIMKFGAYIAQLRKNADMTQSELSDKINLTRQAVSKYERGESFPDISILMLLAKVFGVTVENLIQAGEATDKEVGMLLYRSGEGASIDELMNVAPFLKPSVLDEFTKKLKGQGIDLSHLTSLSEYMNSKSVSELLEAAGTEGYDRELMRRLVPILTEESKLSMFEKIISGEIDWRFIEILLPFAKYISTLVEAAVVEGALPYEALSLMRETLYGML